MNHLDLAVELEELNVLMLSAECLDTTSREAEQLAFCQDIVDNGINKTNATALVKMGYLEAGMENEFSEVRVHLGVQPALEASNKLTGGILAAIIAAMVAILGWVVTKLLGRFLDGASTGGGSGSSSGPSARQAAKEKVKKGDRPIELKTGEKPTISEEGTVKLREYYPSFNFKSLYKFGYFSKIDPNYIIELINRTTDTVDNLTSATLLPQLITDLKKPTRDDFDTASGQMETSVIIKNIEDLYNILGVDKDGIVTAKRTGTLRPHFINAGVSLKPTSTATKFYYKGDAAEGFLDQAETLHAEMSKLSEYLEALPASKSNGPTKANSFMESVRQLVWKDHFVQESYTNRGSIQKAAKKNNVEVLVEAEAAMTKNFAPWFHLRVTDQIKLCRMITSKVLIPYLTAAALSAELEIAVVVVSMTTTIDISTELSKLLAAAKPGDAILKDKSAIEKLDKITYDSFTTSDLSDATDLGETYSKLSTKLSGYVDAHNDSQLALKKYNLL